MVDLRQTNGGHSKKRLTTGSFIEKSIKLHGDLYDYSKVEYIDSVSKVIIICRKHGCFYQVPNSHLCGSGCPKCGLIKNNKNRSGDTKLFVDRSLIVYGNRYDYSKVSYVNAHYKVIIGCLVHGDFKVDPNNFLRGHGCGKCYHENRKAQDFIEKFKKVHGDLYDYSKIQYVNNNTKICINCKKHGDFWQLPRIHHSGHGCPICSSSKGEQLIGNWLDNHSIKYDRSYIFSDLRGLRNKPLRFDFYIEELGVLIEFDGQQHYEPVRFNGMSEKLAISKFERTCECDLLKDVYARQKGIYLLRISYTHIKNLDNILKKLLNRKQYIKIKFPFKV